MVWSNLNAEDYYKEFNKIYLQEKSKYDATEDIIKLDKTIIELTSNKNEIYSQNIDALKDIPDFSEELTQQIIEEFKILKNQNHKTEKLFHKILN